MQIHERFYEETNLKATVSQLHHSSFCDQTNFPSLHKVSHRDFLDLSYRQGNNQES